MDRTFGEFQTYWAAVAQIIPVIALALVLEARLLARRFAKKKSKTGKWTRVLTGTWVLATWALLFWAETLALGGLIARSDQKLAGDDRAQVTLSALAIVNGLLLVAHAPISRILIPVVGILTLEFKFAVPWGTPQRLRRDLRAAMSRVDTIDRKLTEERFRAWMVASESLVLLGKAARNDRRLAQLGTRQLSPDDRAELNALLAESTDGQRRMTENYTDAITAIDKIGESFVELDDMRATEASYLDRLKNIRNHEDKDVRKLLQDLWIEAGRE